MNPASGSPNGFSLVQGGPAYRLLSRSGLTLRRQIILLPALTWVPIAILSAAAGTAIGHAVRMPLIADFVVHVRLLLVLPLYLIAERFIDEGARLIVSEFVVREVIGDDDRHQALVRSAERLRDSAVVEWALLLLALARAYRAVHAHPASSWITLRPGAPLTPAGWWYAALALPILFFISGRWMWRFFIWSYYLARVSRMTLHLIASHPDSAAGIGFISLWHTRFSFLVFAWSSELAAGVANLIRAHGHTLLEYREAIISIVIGEVALVFAPLLFFTPLLLQSFVEGKSAYGRLGMDYVRQFERRWIRPGVADDEQLLGAPDIQSLADLANSYEVVSGMRIVLFNRKESLRLVFLAAAPFLPLLLTMMPAREALKLILSLIK